MARVRLVWVWLIALIMAVMAGCGGDDTETGDAGGKTDAKTDTVAMDVRSDSDARSDTPMSDTPMSDTPAADNNNRPDTPVTPDAPGMDTTRPPDADSGSPQPDVRNDTVVPPDNSNPQPDVAIDNVVVDNTVPPSDVTDASLCTNDNQCPNNKPHCNTTTGACVSRSSIAVTPPNPTIALGTTQQFAATVTYSDNSTGDVTSQATWTSGTTANATINVSTGLATSVAKGTSIISATFAGLSGQTTLTVSDETLVSLQVTPPSASIPVGLTQNFTVIGTYTDQSTQDLTTQASWTSSATNFATIGANTGVATGVALGSTVITAAFGGKTSTANLTVTTATLQSITVTPANRTIGRQTTQPFVATGNYSDNTNQILTAQATWSSSDNSIATVSDTAGSKGLATGVGPGVATITAAFGGKSGTAQLTVTGAPLVSITVNPASPTVANGLVVPFMATGTYGNSTTQDLTTLVTWTSSDTGVAIISNAPGSQGFATTVTPGGATITAALGSINGTATLTVTNATLESIEIAPLNVSIAKGTTQQYSAVGTYTDHTTLDITTQVTWGSSNATIAPISNAVGTAGLATGSTPGAVTINATLSGKSASTGLTVTNEVLVAIGVSPLNSTIAKGNQLQYAALGTYSDQSQKDITTSVTWNSSDVSIATISSALGTEGLAFGANVGTVTISASIGTVSGSTPLHVNTADLVSIAVTPPNPVIPKGSTQQFTAIGTYTDNSTQDLTNLASWSSGNSGTASVSGTGLATGNNPGTTAITANYNGVSGSTNITVNPADLVSISITPASSSTPAGTNKQFHATGTYTDSTTADLTALVTWASSAPAAATISNTVGTQGLAHGVAEGATNITATSGTIVGTTDFHVTPALLQTIQVNPTTPTIPKGTTQQFTATGLYSDGSNVDLTALVTWSSGTTSTATINNAGSKGLATAVNAGTSMITATYNSTTGSTLLTVNAATLQSISLTPATPTIAKGTTVQFTATGHYSDLSTRNLTALATWTTSDATHAAISNTPGSQGLATGAGVGGATITATYTTVPGSTTITVTNETLSTIEVLPAGTTNIAKGTTQQYAAWGHYTDSSLQDLTLQVLWGSSATQFATVSNTVGTQGLVTGVAGTGDSTITASLNGVQGSATIHVTAATLSTVTVTPANGSLQIPNTLQFVAQGTYSDSTVQTITTLCTWNVSLVGAQTGQATISNGVGSKGVATAVGAGDVTISAVCPETPANITGTTVLHVTP